MNTNPNATKETMTTAKMDPAMTPILGGSSVSSVRCTLKQSK